MEIRNVYRDGVTENMLHKPVHLDLDKYKKLWKPNDCWRLASFASNMDIHIDYAYDLIVRLMRNVIKNYKDGYIGFFNAKLIAVMAGWPFKDSVPFVYNLGPVTSYFFWTVPYDGFLTSARVSDELKQYLTSRYPKRLKGNVWYAPHQMFVDMEEAMTERTAPCAKVRDIKQWEYYIENSDPDIGQGDWSYCELKSGPHYWHMGDPMPKKLPEETKQQNVMGKSEYSSPEYTIPWGEQPLELKQILIRGIGDKPWREYVKEYNLTHPKPTKKTEAKAISINYAELDEYYSKPPALDMREILKD